jgi:hypothetical protein
MSPRSLDTEPLATPIYDTIYLPDSLFEARRGMAFVLPVGQAVKVKNGSHIKTFEDTNMLLAAMLDYPKSMLVRAIEAYFVDEQGIVPCSSRWYAEASLALNVSRKQHFEAPLAKCLNPAALIDLSLGGMELLTAQDLLLLKKEFQQPLSIPVEIRSQESFEVTVAFSDWCNWTRRSAPEKLVIMLCGELQVAAL